MMPTTAMMIMTTIGTTMLAVLSGPRLEDGLVTGGLGSVVGGVACTVHSSSSNDVMMMSQLLFTLTVNCPMSISLSSSTHFWMLLIMSSFSWGCPTNRALKVAEIGSLLQTRVNSLLARSEAPRSHVAQIVFTMKRMFETIADILSASDSDCCRQIW